MLSPNFASPVGHTAEVAVAASQPAPKSASAFPHTSAESVATTQPDPKSASPSGHTSTVGVAAAQVVLLPNFASPVGHASAAGVAHPDPASTWPFGQTASQPDPKSASPSGHTAEVAVAASQPDPKSASPSEHSSREHGARKVIWHLPGARSLKSSWVAPCLTCTAYCFPGVVTDRSRLGIRRAVRETGSPPPAGWAVTVTAGATR